MKTTACNENSTPSYSSQPFFNKKREGSLLSSTNKVEQPFFSPNPDIQRNPVSPYYSGVNNFGNISIFTPRSQSDIQPKLTINEPGDENEQEADAMADRVMRMSASVSEGGDENMVRTNPLNVNGILRKCTACEEEEKVQREELEEPIQASPLMRKADGRGYAASSQLTSQLSSSKGGGEPLPKQTLGFMNQAFGTEFSKVRVHTGSQAAEMSAGIQAKAFTHGSDIYFNHGEYNPESSEGKRLLGHELTHVVQQQPPIHRQTLASDQSSAGTNTSLRPPTPVDSSKLYGSQQLSFLSASEQIQRHPAGLCPPLPVARVRRERSIYMPANDALEAAYREQHSGNAVITG